MFFATHKKPEGTQRYDMLHGKKNVRNKRPYINNAEVSNLVWQNHKRNVTVKHPQNMEGCFYHLKNTNNQTNKIFGLLSQNIDTSYFLRRLRYWGKKFEIINRQKKVKINQWQREAYI